MAEPSDVLSFDAMRPEYQQFAQLISRQYAGGAIDSQLTNTFRGLNYRGAGHAAPVNNDLHGLTFFTKPCLNLSYDNLTQINELTPLLTENQLTLQRIIRATLDPRNSKNNFVDTPLEDKDSPFINMLSNLLVNMPGWPDYQVNSWITQPGRLGEATGFVDSPWQLYAPFTVNANFRNTRGDPLTGLFAPWVIWESAVHQGTVNPYRDKILLQEQDYNTRIYRLVLDRTYSWVQAIACCGAAYPTTCPIGAKFDHADDHPRNNNMDQISIQFQCYGAIYNNPKTIYDFNWIVGVFNVGMRDANRDSMMRKLTLAERPWFQSVKSYPRIDPRTFEFQVWVSQEDYNAEVTTQRLLQTYSYGQGVSIPGNNPLTR